jgi:hypothetical protein
MTNNLPRGTGTSEGEARERLADVLRGLPTAPGRGPLIILQPNWSLPVPTPEVPSTEPTLLSPTVRDEANGGVTYTPFIGNEGYQVGFKCEHDDGRVKWIYFTPTDDSSGSDSPDVFVYEADTPTWAEGSPICFINTLTGEEGDPDDE